MSALPRKQTCAAHSSMSALDQKRTWFSAEVCRPRRNYDDLIFLGMPETPRYLRTIVTSAQLGEKMIATEVGPSNLKKGGLASDKKSSALLDTPESLTA